MATGALDANGIWQYGPDDQRVPFDNTLNLGQAATSTAIGTLKSRATDLENAGLLSAVGTPFVAAAGWSIASNAGRKKNGLAFVRITANRTGAAITVPGDGNIADTVIATFAAGWAPVDGMPFPATSEFVADIARIVTTGLSIVAVAPGLTIPTGRLVSFAAVYPLG